MLNLNHPQSRHIFVASKLEDAVLERAKKMTLVPSVRRRELQAECQQMLTAKHPPVLVHCYAGRSRSAAVVCSLLMRDEGNSLAEAMRRITSKRKVAIAAGLQKLLDLK